MREAFGCGFYPGPDQQPRSNKTVYGNAVWQRLQHQNDLAINNATRSKQEQQQTPTRSRQGHHALGVDGTLLMELLALISINLSGVISALSGIIRALYKVSFRTKSFKKSARLEHVI